MSITLRSIAGCVTTDRAPAYPQVIDELLPTACHVTEQYATCRRSWPAEGPAATDARPETAPLSTRDQHRTPSRTCAADTMNSAWKWTHAIGFRRHSRNSLSPSDHSTPRLHLPTLG
jgi:hypothetical protein